MKQRPSIFLHLSNARLQRCSIIFGLLVSETVICLKRNCVVVDGPLEKIHAALVIDDRHVGSIFAGANITAAINNHSQGSLTEFRLAISISQVSCLC